MLRRQRTTSASSLSVSGKKLVPSSRWWSVRFLRRSVRGEYQIAGSTPCASAPSHRYHAMPPRKTRNSDRPRASDRTMVATKSNRLPSFKNRRALSPRENETKGTEEQARAKPPRAIEGHISKQWAGYRDKKTSRLPAEGEVFLLTSPFIEPAIS